MIILSSQHLKHWHNPIHGVIPTVCIQQEWKKRIGGWPQRGSNSWPLACKASALPLSYEAIHTHIKRVGCFAQHFTDYTWWDIGCDVWCVAYRVDLMYITIYDHEISSHESICCIVIVCVCCIVVYHTISACFVCDMIQCDVRKKKCKKLARGGARTPGQFLKRESLYRLSYTGHVVRLMWHLLSV